ncbi:MAG: DUF4386 domain-containing protein, partial [Acidimicrobiia bacterium]|nr:DUF4386 domain-containing protein [Acidimicrobiia bacterium]
ILSSANPVAEAAASPNSMIAGGLLVLAMGLPLSMIPIVLYPLFKRHNEILAMGAVLFRGVLEAMVYVAMALTMFVMTTIGRDLGAAESEAWSAVLVGAMDWMEVLLATVFSIGAVMLGWLFYKTEIIPRWLALWGLIGGVLYFVAPFAVMFDIQNLELSLTTGIGFLLAPLAIQEMVFAVWVLVKGFRRDGIEELVKI